MKHVGSSRAWRSARPRHTPSKSLGALSALIFNICLVALPIAGAASLFVIARDQLYAYELSPAGQRAVRNRVERLAGELILLDFDRHRQWDDLIAMELINGDVAAARGFLLSARRMLPPREANQLDHRVNGGADDADIELAALELLTPGTRARYEATVPLLSRRSASGVGDRRDLDSVLGDQRDFELLARATLGDSSADPVHFTLTGLGLGLGGEFTPRMQAGASALIIAARRQDYPSAFGDEINALITAALPVDRFRTNAITGADGGDSGAYANAAAAFSASLIPDRVATLKEALDEIGVMSEASSVAGASVLLTHAESLRDIPRLRLVAQAAGDRAIAAAKGLPRDGRLARAARGDLTFTRDLSLYAAAAGLAALGLIALVLLAGFRAAQQLIASYKTERDEDGGELVETFTETWRPL